MIAGPQNLIDNSHASRQPSSLLLAMLLALVCLCAYWGVTANDFIALDEKDAITGNSHIARGLTWSGILWAFTDLHYYDYWHPVTWLTHMADVSLYGLKPWGHHLTNLLFHLGAALLLFGFLAAATRNRILAFSAAALFAVHPLHVESVAWVIERKDVVSAFFWFACLYVYTAYVRRPASAVYVTALVLYVMSMLAKPMMVTGPVLLLLIDLLLLRRVQTQRAAGSSSAGEHGLPSVWFLLIEKVPFALVAAASGILTYCITVPKIAAASANHVLSARLANAAVSCIAYLGRTMWPQDLAVYYPFPARLDPLLVTIAVATVCALVLTAVLAVKRRPWLSFGIAWYTVGLLPVLGLVQTGDQSMADRFTYIPMVGMYVIAGHVTAALLRTRWRAGVVAGATVALAALVVLTRSQVAFWRNSETLFTHAIAVAGGSATMHNNLGVELMDQGRIAEASRHFLAASELRPGDANPYQNYGLCMLQTSKYTQAIAALTKANLLQPAHFETLAGLARTYASMGDSVAARNAARSAAGLAPDTYGGQMALGGVWMSCRLYGSAATAYLQAAALDTSAWEPHYNLGLVLMADGDALRAAAQFWLVARRLPGSPGPLTDAGIALMHGGMPEDAVGCLTQALALDSNLATALVYRSAALDCMGRPDAAQEDLRRAVARDGSAVELYAMAARLCASNGISRDAREDLRVEPRTNAATIAR